MKVMMDAVLEEKFWHLVAAERLEVARTLDRWARQLRRSARWMETKDKRPRHRGGARPGGRGR